MMNSIRIEVIFLMCSICRRAVRPMRTMCFFFGNDIIVKLTAVAIIIFCVNFLCSKRLFFCFNDFEVDLHTHAHLWSVNYEIIHLNLKSVNSHGKCHFYYHQITNLIYFLSNGTTIVASSKKNNIYRVRRINTNIQREKKKKYYGISFFFTFVLINE